ncbi:MAG: cysteine desulfurase [Candidatus Eisenbacteria bacterium]|uniref:Cysteine desulfurase n=1 Tax=Eiseniibacteriota bacterium TaxID=2212470 RepID=A0A849SMW0_UNCEI|nr:cysteine desulfurase [Candidatus Eisenbacteria bacterium]
MREVYADHAATTRMAPEVLDAMLPYLGERFGNPSSVHARGDAAREALTAARERVAIATGANLEEVVFTAGGSEANNLALKGIVAMAAPERRRLVVSAVEHPSVLETARELEREGVPVTIVPVDADGIVSIAALERAIDSDVALVSLMIANNETGAIQPIAAAAALAHAAGARLHTDAVQALGKLPVSMATLDADLLSLAAHKFHGPPGVGALIVRRRTRLLPLVHGGHQERGRRAGTENLAGAVGLGVAIARAEARRESEAQRVSELSLRLWEGLRSRVERCRRNGPEANRLPGVLNLSFEGVDGEAVLHELDRHGITISTGSACSAAAAGPSHVLIAMGLSPELAHASVRFSLGEDTTEADLDHILQTVPPVVARLRSLGGPALERSA